MRLIKVCRAYQGIKRLVQLGLQTKKEIWQRHLNYAIKVLSIFFYLQTEISIKMCALQACKIRLHVNHALWIPISMSFILSKKFTIFMVQP